MGVLSCLVMMETIMCEALVAELVTFDLLLWRIVSRSGWNRLRARGMVDLLRVAMALQLSWNCSCS